MKKLFKVLVALVIVALAAHCNGDGGNGGSNPLAEQAEKLLNNTWSFDTDNSTIVDGDWAGFQLAVPFASGDGGTFQISNAPTGFEAVWTNGGDSWDFVDDNEDLIARGSNGIEITIDQVDETNLLLSFTLTGPGGRTSGIDGEWTFVFDAN